MAVLTLPEVPAALAELADVISIGINWDQLGSIGINWDQLGSIGINWDFHFAPY
eukprot:SAG31_NODE_150_length_22290_cov_5.975801_21_plen_54_part_00